MQVMRVLIVGYEAAPYYKRGGLGDVVGSLPKALREIGVDAHIVIPYYKDIETNHREKKIGQFSVVFGKKLEQVGIYSSSSTSKVKASAYFLQNRTYLDKIFTRGKNKKIGQFAFFDLAVVEFIAWLSSSTYPVPNIVHCNDWHTGLIPLILKKKGFDVPTLLTIHNLDYQGKGSLKVLDSLHIADDEVRVIKRGVPATKINLLGEGIIHATRVSTVSPSYAKEIAQTEHDHNPISPFLKKREEEHPKTDGKIIGILNGIDYDIWNPAKDELIFHKFDISNWETGKKDNKQDLLKSLGLEDRPTFCFVGRMAKQKGLDVLIRAIKRISHFDINLIILGSGDPRIQASVLEMAEKFPWIKAELVYNEKLAHKIYAGSDFIIIPSRYEPCGLIQMIAMSYGTLPIASKTGGLKDSIHNGRNGFLFKKGSPRALVETVEKALVIFEKHPLEYEKMVLKSMQTDFSWKRSAILYKKLYLDIAKSSD